MKVWVTLFKKTGRYHTSEEWEVPDGTLSPADVGISPDFRRIDGGAVLVNPQDPWGYPHLFPGVGWPAPRPETWRSYGALDERQDGPQPGSGRVRTGMATIGYIRSEDLADEL